MQKFKSARDQNLRVEGLPMLVLKITQSKSQGDMAADFSDHPTVYAAATQVSEVRGQVP